MTNNRTYLLLFLLAAATALRIHDQTATPDNTTTANSSAITPTEISAGLVKILESNSTPTITVPPSPLNLSTLNLTAPDVAAVINNLTTPSTLPAVSNITATITNYVPTIVPPSVPTVPAVVPIYNTIGSLVSNASASSNSTIIRATILDDLLPAEQNELNNWRNNLVPFARFEDGRDRSAFFSSQIEKYAESKKKEIKGKRNK